MAKRINTLNTASSPANDDYLPIDGATNGTRKISASFFDNIIEDVTVDGTSVVSAGVAEIDLSGKQDTLTAGSNITIAQDGTISATDTTYTAGTNVDITGGVISATDTTYTAGTNVTIDANNVISASDTTYSAGTNVQINNGVISATDTTYSAFGGATAGADGSIGLVPQPLIADKDKFLKGDGTWDTIQPGASALDDLTNVDITSPTNGQVLKYDSTNQEWVNANESGGGGGSTVTITPTLSTGTKIADYSIDGSTGALYAPNGGGGSSTLSGLSDVTITSPTDGQGLVYDATNQVWVNGDVGGGSCLVKLAEYSGAGHGFSEGDTITLSDNMINYDVLMFASNYSDDVSGWINGLVTVSDFKTKYTGRFYAQYQKDGYTDVKYLTDTTISVLRASGAFVNAVYGIKFANGGSSSFIKYSTDEYFVGNWIDGSPVYEKTYYLQNISSDYTTIDLGILSSSIDLIWVHEGFAYKGTWNSGTIMPYTGSGAAGELGFIMDISKANTNITTHSRAGSLLDGGNAYITFRYTKASS